MTQALNYSVLGPGLFRLLKVSGLSDNGTLTCELHHVAFQDDPAYIALSYTWNNESPSVPIECNAKVFLITQTLRDALDIFHQPAYTGPPYVWCDGICIDQKNNEEKAQQVPLMGSIYSKAACVFIWLGPSGAYTDALIDQLPQLIEVMEKLQDKSQAAAISEALDLVARLGNHGDWGNHWVAIVELFERSWFQRLWTMQEVILAQNAIAFCGMNATDIRHIWSLADELRRTGLSGALAKHSRDPQEFHDTLSIMSTTGLNWAHVQVYGRSDLWAVADSARERKTSMAVDKVYGVLGLVEEDIRRQIEVDYSEKVRQNPVEIYLRWAHLLLQERPNLNVLTTVSSQSRLPELPSWCPDFGTSGDSWLVGNPENESGYLEQHQDKLAHVSTSIDSREITLEGYEVDQVKEVGIESFPEFHPIPTTISHIAAQVIIATTASKIEQFVSSCRILASQISLVSGLSQKEDTLQRTLITNRFEKGADVTTIPTTHQLKEMYYYFDAYLQARGSHQGFSPEQWILSGECMLAMRRACNDNKRFFTTHENRMGLGRPSVASGDLVCLFPKAYFPLILRPHDVGDERKFELIGEAYVDGVMQTKSYVEYLQNGREEKLFTLV